MMRKLGKVILQLIKSRITILIILFILPILGCASENTALKVELLQLRKELKETKSELNKLKVKTKTNINIEEKESEGSISDCKNSTGEKVQKDNHDEERKLENSLGIEFVKIPSGEFNMGCTSYDNECAEWEKPQHKVKISRPFYLGKYEVTQGQWKKLMGYNPSKHQECGDNCPVENVSWNDVKKFIDRLCKKEKQNPCKYRLPTEAEWEYSARAGTNTINYWGDDRLNFKYEWTYENSHTDIHENGKTNPVGLKLPNPWGLYDMMGNVKEWVNDYYNDKYYNTSPSLNPRGGKKGEFKSPFMPKEKEFRCSRGDSFFAYPLLAKMSGGKDYPVNRISTRGAYPSKLKIIDVGFRLVMDL